MKHNRILGGLIALVMFMITSVSAMAQEYELNSVTFLKPGEKGVISVSMNNPNTVDAFQGKIILPEGLTFVDTDTEGRGQISKTARTDKFSISLQKNSENPRIAAFLGFSMTDAVQSGSGAIFTFEVNVANDFKNVGEITIKEAQIAMDGSGIVIPENDVIGKVADVADQVLASAEDIKVNGKNPATVTISCDFQKEFLAFFAATIELPKGLSIVDKSWKSDADRCPNHSASVVGKLLTVVVDDIFGNLNFVKKDGNVVSFEVVADDDFVDGSEIVLKNVYGTAKLQGNSEYENYYAEDIHIKVTKDNPSTGINGINADDFAAKADGIYTVSGLKVNKLVKGINIVVKDGKATKVFKK